MYSEEARRRHPGLLNWCGIGIAWLLQHRIGHHLDDGMCVPVRLRRGIAQHVLPSTYRANSMDHWAEAGVAPPPQVPPDDIRPGDIVTVVTASGNPYGDHFVVASSEPGETFDTIECNASGELGDGSDGRGVVRRTRRTEDVRRVYRLEPKHFDQGID